MASFNLAGLHEVFNVYEPARPELGVYPAGRSQFPRLPATEMSDVFVIERPSRIDESVPYFQNTVFQRCVPCVKGDILL